MLAVFLFVFIVASRLLWKKKKWHYSTCPWYPPFLILLSLLGACAISHMAGDGMLAKDMATYEGLMYKVECSDCRDEFGMMNKDIIDEITKWNIHVTKKQSLQGNWFIGFLYPDIYDDYQLIEYNSFNTARE